MLSLGGRSIKGQLDLIWTVHGVLQSRQKRPQEAPDYDRICALWKRLNNTTPNLSPNKICSMYMTSPCSQSLSQKSKLGHGRPLHRNQDAALHLLNQRNRLVHRVGPALYAPALLTANLALLEVGKLPQVVHRVEVANLHKPRAHALHDLAPRLEPAPPVRLPLEQVAGVQRVRAQLKEAAEVARGRGGPEAELLHQRAVLVADERAQLLVELGVLGVVRDGVERGVVALVALVLPDVDCGGG